MTIIDVPRYRTQPAPRSGASRTWRCLAATTVVFVGACATTRLQPYEPYRDQIIARSEIVASGQQHLRALVAELRPGWAGFYRSSGSGNSFECIVYFVDGEKVYAQHRAAPSNKAVEETAPLPRLEELVEIRYTPAGQVMPDGTQPEVPRNPDEPLGSLADEVEKPASSTRTPHQLCHGINLITRVDATGG